MSGIDPTLTSDFYAENGAIPRDNTIPRFYLRPVKNEFKSVQEGRPIFEDREYVEIIIPGNRGTLVDTPVREEHRQRWARLYDAFKTNSEQVTEGTPLEEWPAVTRSQVEELKFFHVRTVEQLAGLDDQAIARVSPQGGFQLRERAKAFLEQAAGNAPSEALSAKVDAYRDTITAMEEREKHLLARLEALENKRGDAA